MLLLIITLLTTYFLNFNTVFYCGRRNLIDRVGISDAGENLIQTAVHFSKQKIKLFNFVYLPFNSLVAKTLETI